MEDVEIYIELFQKYIEKTNELTLVGRKIQNEIDFYQSSPPKKKNQIKYRLIQNIQKELFFRDISKDLFLKAKEIDHERLKVRYLYHLIDINYPLINSFKAKERLIKKALYLQDFYFVFEMSTNQYASFSNFIQNKIEAKKYQNLKEEAFRMIIEFNESKIVYDYFLSLVAKRLQFGRSTIEDEMINRMRRLIVLQENNSSFEFNFNTYCSLYYYYLIKGDRRSKDVCINAINYFEKIKDITLHGFFSFRIKLGFFYFSDKDFIEAEKYFKIPEDVKVIKGSASQLNSINHLLSTWIHSGQYEKAFNSVKEITRHKSFSKSSFIYQEPIRIKSAYLHLLKAIGKFSIPNDTSKKFRINKFLNEVPLYSKDKRGINIAILIIHVLYLFLEKKYDLILNRLRHSTPILLNICGMMKLSEAMHSLRF